VQNAIGGKAVIIILFPMNSAMSREVAIE